MPKLYPIRAIRYPGRDLSTKIAPPYDVLDEGPKRELLDRDPSNIVAIDLPVTPPKTVGPDEAYEQAGATFRRWLAQGVLMSGAEPAVFAYEQVFEANGEPVRRRGFFANLGVEEFNRPGGGIFRHEHTIQGGTDDRLKLMRATAAQLSPVFGIYEDLQKSVRAFIEPNLGREPDAIGKTDNDGVEHRLWTIRDPAVIEGLQQAFTAIDVFIADGHHRYTTALNYSREHSGTPEAGTCLFALVAAEDPGLNVLPTHRVLYGLEGYTFDKLRQVIEADGRFEFSHLPSFRLDPHDGPRLIEQMREGRRFSVGLYDPANEAAYLLTARNDDPLEDILPDQPMVWRQLDVAILHELLIDRILRTHFGGASIAYKYYGLFHDFIGGCSGPGDRVGIIMRPTPLQSVLEVSRAGGVMPPKSTFFFPKLATGLIINPLG